MAFREEVHMDLEQLEPVHTAREHTNSVDAIKIDPSSKKKFATGSHDRTIKIWDITKVKVILTCEADSKGIWCLDYSSDGKELLSSSSSGVCKLWDIKTGKATSKLSAHKSSAFWAAYSQACDKIVTGGVDKMVYLWDRKNTSKPLKKLVGNESIVRSVGFINNDKHIISTTLEGEITIFDVKSGDIVVHEKCLGDKEEIEGNIIYCVRPFNKTGDGKLFMTTHEDCVARSWEFDPSGKEIKMMDVFPGHSNTVRYIDFSPSEKRFVTACEDQSLRVWDYTKKKGLYILAGHTNFCVAADFLDEKTLISASWDQTINFWKLPS